MIRTELKNIANHILSLNPYFDNGYDNAFIEVESGEIFAQTERGLSVIFPEDRVGNYFFLLIDGEISISDAPRLNDNSKSYFYKLSMAVVAVVDDANEMALLSNLKNSLGGYKGESKITLNKANIDTFSTISELLKGVNKSAHERALSRVKRQTIIMIETAIQIKVNVLDNCIVNVCESCEPINN